MNALRTKYRDGRVLNHTYVEFAEVCGMKASAVRMAVKRGAVTKKMAKAGIISFTKVVNIKGGTKLQRNLRRPPMKYRLAEDLVPEIVRAFGLPVLDPQKLRLGQGDKGFMDRLEAHLNPDRPRYYVWTPGGALLEFVHYDWVRDAADSLALIKVVPTGTWELTR